MPSLPPFFEVIGTISKVEARSIVFVSRIEIEISSCEKAKWNDMLRKGKQVAIIKLDDETIRVRKIKG